MDTHCSFFDIAFFHPEAQQNDMQCPRMTSGYECLLQSFQDAASLLRRLDASDVMKVNAFPAVLSKLDSLVALQ